MADLDKALQSVNVANHALATAELHSGDKIVYVVEDSGSVLSNEEGNLTLLPGQPLTVGSDVSLELANNLFKNKIVRKA